jgi:predicted  nucleic acid-binding Zn-ribbon protein
MSVLTIDKGKNIEFTDLEAHVVMAQQRYRALEDRIARSEVEIAKINDRNRVFMRILLGAAASLVTGTALSVLSMILGK